MTLRNSIGFLTTIASLATTLPALAVLKGREVKDPNRWNQTVGFGELSPSSRKDSIFCTGVLIHPRIVLTAAHCIYKSPGMNEANWALRTRVYLGNGSSDTVLAKNVISVVRTHPEYLTSPHGWSDYAYVILKNPVQLEASSEVVPSPADAKFNPYLHANNSGILPILMDPKDHRDATVTDNRFRKFAQSVGFGVDQTSISGIKREGFVELDKYSALDEVFAKADPQESNREKPELLMDPKTTGLSIPVSFIGSGDSGGPLFALNSKKQWALLALVSRATEKSYAKPTFAFSSVRTGICWVYRSLKEEPLRSPYANLDLGLSPEGQIACDQYLSPANATAYTLFVLTRLYSVPQSKSLPTLFSGIVSAISKEVASSKPPVHPKLDLSDMFLTDVRLVKEVLSHIKSLRKNPLILNLKGNRIRSISRFKGLMESGAIHQMNVGYNDLPIEEVEAFSKYGSKIQGLRLQPSVRTNTPFKAMCDCSTQRVTSSARPRASDKECDAESLRVLQSTAKDIGLPFRSDDDAFDAEPVNFFARANRDREQTIFGLWKFFFGDQSEVSCRSLNSELIRRTSLTLEFPALSDFSPLTGFEGLKNLSIQNQLAVNWNFLKGLNLHSLNLNNTGLSDLSAVEHMTKLEYLYVEGNSITSIAPIVRLIESKYKTFGPENLKSRPLKVCLHKNNVTDMELADRLVRAKVLELVLDKPCKESKNPFGL